MSEKPQSDQKETSDSGECASSKKAARWAPLASDPQVLDDYVKKIGGPAGVSIQDVLSTEEWAFDMITGDVLGMLFLFPVRKESEDRGKKEDESITSGATSNELPTKLWFTKQTVHNACGTVGLLHIFANCGRDSAPGGDLSAFFSRVEAMSPEERAHALEVDSALSTAHQGAATATTKDKEAAAKSEEVDHHYIALVNVDGHLVELDGRRSQPISRGKTNPSTLLKDSVASLKKNYMDHAPGELGFCMLAVTSNDSVV